jgi:hypothetical protein
LDFGGESTTNPQKELFLQIARTQLAPYSQEYLEKKKSFLLTLALT